ncbi:hypothetical protein A3J17_00440 [Candidatus Curtissbacteria bacterium RIFCSPLOWO2_02_FULL_40_11]|uniref:D-alanine--D-alanine ligase n=2 Tax=Candidatus Curtissiibacteriota TaxID=1752717 RepID=A0A1F5G9V0_9BACT|nr:MAG: hypothetical protein A3D04_01045 [Candidatus Curtissbacteria bacterium RIFCSPHIGHO2_02_FULL_40_16b]OGE01527.1 MAG: hypothetical protein A3J17_00440 [Candidatus Curtissbacteria bacterium RIFCSPLOWO2_02_FULL_40_11]OGE13861.1 MAG: hypothetical protein A3G14_01785 [Candidatus Curtissbacteria bacterium RIFCSPLOWO2_12_FULL_38_9]
MSKKINVAVLMGGKSAEHDISLITGGEVVKNLDSKKYRALSIVISKDGKLFKFNDKNYPLSQLSAIQCQLFFIAMHGSSGEDGRIQGFLDFLGVAYTGSGVLASALGMDKLYSRKLFTQAGLTVPKTVAVKKGKTIPKLNFDFPVFVKPNNQGSSVGVFKVKNKKELVSALKKSHKYSDQALVEESVDGVEVTSSILGKEKPVALPLVEIVPKTQFFNYKAKYNERFCEEIVPARISKILTKKAKAAAILAYQTIGCQGFGRVDMIIKNNKVYVLEVNTIPGLTAVSLLPKAAKATGISYRQLLNEIISFAHPIV